ncbi:hypothetical protein ACFLU5_12550 [Bacteroidota bacterium]
MNSSTLSFLIIILTIFLNSCHIKNDEIDKKNRDVECASELLVGFAKVNITPSASMRLCGTFEERLALGVHDSLFVRAFIFEQGNTKFVIAGCDLAMVFPEVCDSVRNRVSILGLPPDHVLVHASETHNGPDYFGEFRDVFHERAIKQYGNDPAESIDYSAFLIEKISDAIHSANENMKSAAIYFSFGECRGIAFNRRFRMKDGSVGWNPGKLNPLIVEPLGPVDESLPVLTIYRNGESNPSALLTGYGMHLAILEDAYYGADYPYYLAQKLQSTISPDLFTHFLQAPCCEVNHINVKSSEPQSGHHWAQVVGEKLAGSMVKILENQGPPLLPDLKIASRVVPLELQEFSDEEIEKQRKIWHSQERSEMHFLEVVHAGKVTGIYDRHMRGPVHSRIQAFQIDPETVLLGLPSEVSVEFGLKIQEESPYENTMIVQLSNDWLGYIPPKHIFEEGHYEAVVAKIKPGEGEKLVDMSLELLENLKKAE